MNVAAGHIRKASELASFSSRRDDRRQKERGLTSASGQTRLSSEKLGSLVMAISCHQDRAAFAELFQLMAPRIKAYLMSLGTLPEAAEEVAQEAMLAVWRKASYFDASRASASTWIFTIARNLRIDHQRRQRATDPLTGDEAEDPSLVPTPEKLLIDSLEEERVRTALAALPPEQQAIVRLSFFSDQPHSEIARELGLPLGTVKSRIRLALGRLRRLLDDAS